MENSHEKNLFEIHLSNLNLIVSQAIELGGIIYAPPVLVSRYLNAKENLTSLAVKLEKPIPGDPEIDQYISKLQEQTDRKYEEMLGRANGELDNHTKNLLRIHCRNICHYENQKTALENENKLPDAVLDNLIQKVQDSIDNLRT